MHCGPRVMFTTCMVGSDGNMHVSGTALFHGFELSSKNAGVLPPAPRLQRRLEFIGDSDTAGWCADGSPSGAYDTAHKYENAHETWAAQLAGTLKVSE
jgi:hypothetical protein